MHRNAPCATICALHGGSLTLRLQSRKVHAGHVLAETHRQGEGKCKHARARKRAAYTRFFGCGLECNPNTCLMRVASEHASSRPLVMRLSDIQSFERNMFSEVEHTTEVLLELTCLNKNKHIR